MIAGENLIDEHFQLWRKPFNIHKPLIIQRAYKILLLIADEEILTGIEETVILTVIVISFQAE